MTRYSPQWLQAGVYGASADRRLIGALWPAPASTGCAVTATTGMALSVAPGQVAVPSPNNTGSTLCTSDAPEAVAIAAAPPSGQERFDLVVCQARGADLDGGANNDFVFVPVAGIAAAPPAAVPAVPAGTVALAQVHIAGGVAAIVAGDLTDLRPGRLAIGTAIPDWVPRGFIGGGFNTVAPGNGSALPHQVTVNLIAGRVYHVTAGVSAGAAGAATTIRLNLSSASNQPVGNDPAHISKGAVMAWQPNLSGGEGSNTVSGGNENFMGDFFWKATATGPQTFYIGSTGSATTSYGVGVLWIWVNDVGTGAGPTS